MSLLQMPHQFRQRIGIKLRQHARPESDQGLSEWQQLTFEGNVLVVRLQMGVQIASPQFLQAFRTGDEPMLRFQQFDRRVDDGRGDPECLESADGPDHLIDFTVTQPLCQIRDTGCVDKRRRT